MGYLGFSRARPRLLVAPDAAKSFKASLEDWRHRRAPERYPHREELARGGVVANGGAAVPITATLAAQSFDEDELQQVSAV